MSHFNLAQNTYLVTLEDTRTGVIFQRRIEADTEEEAMDICKYEHCLIAQLPSSVIDVVSCVVL